MVDGASWLVVILTVSIVLTIELNMLHVIGHVHVTGLNDIKRTKKTRDYLATETMISRDRVPVKTEVLTCQRGIVPIRFERLRSMLKTRKASKPRRMKVELG